MFRKRQKKTFPPGTFIPTPARLCAIIQLCLAFSALLWNVSEPFVGEIYTLKSELLLYHEVMGNASNVDQGNTSEKTAVLSDNATRFESLPLTVKNQILQSYHAIKKQLSHSFLDKTKGVFTLFVHQISPYELAWIFFSIVISILLLKRVEGASQVVWLLPLITVVYIAESRWHGNDGRLSLESRLFPTENELLENYIKEPLAEDIFSQKQQLTSGWKRYLIIHWSSYSPSADEMIFENQVKEAEFNFNLARLELRIKQHNFSKMGRRPAYPPFPILVMYFFWNVYFAFTAWRYTFSYSSSPQSAHTSTRIFYHPDS